MKELNDKRPTSRTSNIIVNINGENVDLGKLCTIKSSNCRTTNKTKLRMKCLRTGKTFTDIRVFSSHIVDLLKTRKEILFTDDVYKNK